MELELLTLVALFGVALIAGFIDAIAGGGGLLTVPALLATGMPPVTQVLADVMLCYWPLASWQPQLPPGWTLRDQGLTRRLRAPDGALVSEIHYRDIDGVREPVSLQQHVFHYRLQLETLSR